MINPSEKPNIDINCMINLGNKVGMKKLTPKTEKDETKAPQPKGCFNVSMRTLRLISSGLIMV